MRTLALLMMVRKSLDMPNKDFLISERLFPPENWLRECRKIFYVDLSTKTVLPLVASVSLTYSIKYSAAVLISYINPERVGSSIVIRLNLCYDWSDRWELSPNFEPTVHFHYWAPQTPTALFSRRYLNEFLLTLKLKLNREYISHTLSYFLFLVY